MGIDSRHAAYQQLIELAEKQGYVTFDNIMDCADEHSLPIQDFDWLTNSITTRGVLIYSEAPGNVSSSADDEYDDFAQSDYDGVYDRIVKLSPSLEPFVAFVKNVMPPQRGEIKQLKYQIVDGNTYARDRMIEMHLRLALRVALQRAEAYDMDIEDAVGYACTGLVTAVDRYDPDTSGAFASYAALWILQNISREQSTQRPLVYYPFHKKEDYFTMYPLLKAHGCIGCDELRSCGDALHMVCDKIGCAEDDAQKILLQMIPDERIEELIELYTDENQEYFPKDITAGTILSNLSTETVVSDEDVYLSVQYKMLQEEIRDVLSTLTPREEKVLLLRYGFDGRERTLEEVGAEFNITRERIRQIEAKALRKLRHPSRSKRLKAYL